jgi:hypothetical protein
MDEQIIEKGIFHTYVNNEKIYLKKGNLLGWHIVNLIKNEDGSWNWKNLICGGSWFRLIMIIVFVALCIGAIFEVKHFIDVGNACLNLNNTIRIT